MKLRSLLVLAAGAGAGYLLGTKQGRVKLEKMKVQANHLAHDPRVQAGAVKVADTVSQQSHHLPQPAQSIVRTAADQVHKAVDRTESTPVAAEPEGSAGPPPAS